LHPREPDEELRHDVGSGLAEAVRRHWLMIAIFGIVFAAAGGALGYSKAPTYSAQARLVVGGDNLTTQSIPGYAVGVQSLASAYSRAISADTLVRKTASAVSRPVPDVQASLSASPIPESPLILVEATGASSPEAVQLANSGARQLIRFVANDNSARLTADILRRYRKARAKLAGAQRRLNGYRDSFGRKTNLSASRLTRLQNAQAAVDVAQLQSRSLSDAYSARQAAASEKSVVRVLAVASRTRSDRRSTVERLTLAGFVAGLVLGCGAAILRLGRRQRRT
jgi:capsular polysaccharide biosynthesis protein